MREDISLIILIFLLIGISSQIIVLNYKRNVAMIQKGILKGKMIQKRREQFYIISSLICFGLGLGFFIAMNIMKITDLSIPGGLMLGLAYALFLSYFVVKR